MGFPTPSSGGSPGGAAGGDLAGTYPNPDIGTGVIVNADVNAAAAIAYSKLNLATSIVNADVAAAAAIASSKLNFLPVTALPGSPVDGQLCVFTDSLTAPTYHWMLVYEETTAKWWCIGGTTLISEVTTSEGTGSATYAALATAGPSVTVPLAGTYLVQTQAEVNASAAANVAHSYDIGGTGAVDADGALLTLAASGWFIISSAVRSKSIASASTALVSKYKTSAGTVTYRNRRMLVTPVFVS